MSHKIILGVYITPYKDLQLQNVMGVTWLMITQKKRDQKTQMGALFLCFL